MQIEAVLFDLFDTLLLLIGSEDDDNETYYEPSLRRMYESLRKNGIRVTFEQLKSAYFEVRDRLYSESRESFEEPHFNVRVMQTLQKLGYSFEIHDPVVTRATDAFADEFMRYVNVDKDAIGVLTKLHGKFKLGVVSNFAIPECGWALLEKFGLKAYFDVVLISGEVNRRKPGPEIFERALNALSVDASRTVFVGDMLDLDVKGPKNVGMKTVLIKRRPMESVEGTKPDRVIERLSALPRLLEDWGFRDNNLY